MSNLSNITVMIRYISERLRQLITPVRNTELFDDVLIEVKQYYLQQYGVIPSIRFIKHIDVKKVYELIQEFGIHKISSHTG